MANPRPRFIGPIPLCGNSVTIRPPPFLFVCLRGVLLPLYNERNVLAIMGDVVVGNERDERDIKNYRTFCMEAPAKVFSGTFVNPEAMTAQLDELVGKSVADFGCGSGFFSLAFAKAVGVNGHVFALDILPSSLEAVASRAKALGLLNVVAKRVNLEREGGADLPDSSLDWVILKDVLFQNKDKTAMLREAHRVLKPAGNLLVMEWNDRDLSFGPEVSLRVSESSLREMLSECGFSFVKDLDAGDFHYASVFQKV